MNSYWLYRYDFINEMCAKWGSSGMMSVISFATVNAIQCRVLFTMWKYGLCMLSFTMQHYGSCIALPIIDLKHLQTTQEDVMLNPLRGLLLHLNME